MSAAMVLRAAAATATSAATSSMTSATATATATASSLPTPDAEQLERFSSLAIFLVLTLLILSFCTSYYLRVKRITAVHETIVGLFAGMFVGLCLRVGPGEQVQKMLSFSNTIMLNVLLPPIILASGYDLRQENFFRNFGTILIFAFAGTFISAVVVGVIVYIWSLLHLESISLSLLECLIFGSTLSATDPVTILAIFNTYKVDPKLYSIIFGESLLNDAVSIVMFDTLSTFRGKEIYLSSVFHGIGLFLIVFTFSMLLGVCFGLGCSLLLKHSRLSSYPQLETCLVALIAYTSYFFSNGVTMSGIVSLLFCGITLKHYAYHNMSRRTQRATRYTFQTLANLSENFIFIYLGLSLFTQEILVYKPLFIIVTVLAVVASRYCAVFPIASAINIIKRAKNRRRTSRSIGGGPPGASGEEELPQEYQMMLFWAGLRGAVGFALSAGIEGQNAIALQTTVLVAVVITVIVFGGTTAQMLEILGIRTGVQDDEGDSDDEEDEDDTMRLRGIRRRSEYMDSNGIRNRSSTLRGARGGADGPASSKWKAASGSGGVVRSYRDGSNVSSPRDSVSMHGRGASDARTSRGFGDDLATEDDELASSFSSDLLPSRSGTPAPRGSLSALRSSPTVNTTSIPSLGEIRKAVRDLSHGDHDAAGGEGGITSSPAKQLLDRAGLVMKDGQWFQNIDQKYLLPLFSNSVASRRHEEKKSARIAARGAAGRLDAVEGEEPYGDDRAWTGEEAYPQERDAEIVEEEEEGSEVVFDATGYEARSSSGRNTPVRRTLSRDYSSGVKDTQADDA
ncbi:monovalent cation:H+ antiporter, CPA1 (nhx1) [Thecaphora frezii]